MVKRCCLTRLVVPDIGGKVRGEERKRGESLARVLIMSRNPLVKYPRLDRDLQQEERRCTISLRD
jgi:hypothetical protein